jgi:hypothetical protein
MKCEEAVGTCKTKHAEGITAPYATASADITDAYE